MAIAIKNGAVKPIAAVLKIEDKYFMRSSIWKKNLE